MIPQMKKLRQLCIISILCLAALSFADRAKASVNGKLNMIVGTGKAGFKDGKYNIAELRLPHSAVLVGENLYITDSGNHCIREFNLKTKELRTFTGESLRTGIPEEMAGYKNASKDYALMNKPLGIAADDQGRLYVADSGNHCIRLIQDGEVTTFAGNGQAGYVDGKGENARFDSPVDLVFMNGELYVSDSKNKAIRRISHDGTVTTILQGGDLLEPAGLFARENVLYITDSGAQAVFTYSVKDKIKLLSGANTRFNSNIGYRMFGNKDGKIHEAKYSFPRAVHVDKEAIYICDTWNSSIRRIKGETVSTWMVLKNEKFLAKPTKLLFTDKEIIIVDILNGQILFYEK